MKTLFWKPPPRYGRMPETCAADLLEAQYSWGKSMQHRLDLHGPARPSQCFRVDILQKKMLANHGTPATLLCMGRNESYCRE